MKHFELKELVCPHVYSQYREKAWTFFDPRLLSMLEWLRESLGRPIYVNNWDSGGGFSQRGFRCNCCNIVKSKNSIYCSSHMRGQGIDFDVKGMSADEVRGWIWAHRDNLPHRIRLEKDVNWVHMDVCVEPDNIAKVVFFQG